MRIIIENIDRMNKLGILIGLMLSFGMTCKAQHWLPDTCNVKSPYRLLECTYEGPQLVKCMGHRTKRILKIERKRP